MQDMSKQNDMLTLVCEKFKCGPEEFEHTLIRHSVSPLAWPVVHFMLRFRRDIYEFDLELIEDLKKTTSFAEVSRIISSYCSTPRPRRHLKLVFLARVSKRRLKNLARELFAARPAATSGQ